MNKVRGVCVREFTWGENNHPYKPGEVIEADGVEMARLENSRVVAIDRTQTVEREVDDDMPERAVDIPVTNNAAAKRPMARR